MTEAKKNMGFFANDRAPHALANRLTKRGSPQKLKTIMLSVTDMHDHFNYENKNDKALDFKAMKQTLTCQHGIEIIHDEEITIPSELSNPFFKKLAILVQQSQADNSTPIHLILTAHGGPSWFFGPINDYFKEKVGLVWHFDKDLPKERQMPHAYFLYVEHPKKRLYFVPANRFLHIDAQLTSKQIALFETNFDYENSTGDTSITNLSRQEIQTLDNIVQFDVLFLNTKIGWHRMNVQKPPKKPVFDYPHVLRTADKLYYFNGQYSPLEFHSERLAQFEKSFKCQSFQYKNKSILGALNLSKDMLGSLEKCLIRKNISIRQVDCRHRDFAQDECAGILKVTKVLQALKQKIDFEFSSVILFSCFSAAEFSNPDNHQFSLSSARLLSIALPETKVLGCVGIHADVKTNGLWLKNENEEAYRISVPSLVDSMVTYLAGNIVDGPLKHYFTKLDLEFLRLMRTILLLNNNYVSVTHDSNTLQEVQNKIAKYSDTFAAIQFKELVSILPEKRQLEYVNVLTDASNTNPRMG